MNVCRHCQSIEVVVEIEILMMLRTDTMNCIFLFQGTNADQDNRFSDKEKKLLKQMKFEEILSKKVSIVAKIVDR